MPLPVCRRAHSSFLSLLSTRVPDRLVRDTSTNSNVQNDFASLFSCDVFDIIFHFLPLFPICLHSRAAAGSTALPALPRPSCHLGLFFALDVKGNVQGKVNAWLGVLSIWNRRTHTCCSTNSLSLHPFDKHYSSGHSSVSQEAITGPDTTDTSDTSETPEPTSESTRNESHTDRTRYNQLTGSHSHTPSSKSTTKKTARAVF